MKSKVSNSQKALNLWAIILIIWSIYRYNFKMPDWFDEFIAKPLVFVLPVYYYIKRVEKTDFFSGLNWKTKMEKGTIILGLIMGLVFFITAILGNWVKFNSFVFLPGKTVSLSSIFLIVLMALATGISEEILSRGFILKRLYEESKNIYTSSFFSSILFFFLHVPILFASLKISGNLLLFFMITDLLLSLTISFLYLDKKDLTLPIMVHTLYNLSIYFFT